MMNINRTMQRQMFIFTGRNPMTVKSQIDKNKMPNYQTQTAWHKDNDYRNRNEQGRKGQLEVVLSSFIFTSTWSLSN